MTNALLALAMLVTVAAAIWLALDGRSVTALPLAVVCAGLLSFMVRRGRRSGITPAEVEPPRHDDKRP